MVACVVNSRLQPRQTTPSLLRHPHSRFGSHLHILPRKTRLFLFMHLPEPHFATRFFSHPCSNGGVVHPLPRSFRSKRPTFFRPIPFPFILLRTLWHNQKLNPFVFRRLRTLYPKHPGWGYRSISECEPHSSSNLSVARTGSENVSSLSTFNCRLSTPSVQSSTEHGSRHRSSRRGAHLC